MKPTILIIDDEVRILRALRLIFRDTYDVITTSDPDVFLSTLEEKHVHVILSDQRMPDVRGTELLAQAKTRSPHTIRILLTAYADLEDVMSSINDGEIHKYLTKPWDQNDLRATVHDAVQLALTTHKQHDERTAPAPTGKILVVHDDNVDCEELVNLIKKNHEVIVAYDFSDAIKKVNTDNIAVIISDTRLNGEFIAPSIKTFKRQFPNIISIVVTSFQDTRVLIDLINDGQIFRCLPRPIKENMLEKSIDKAVEQHLRIKQQVTSDNHA